MAAEQNTGDNQQPAAREGRGRRSSEPVQSRPRGRGEGKNQRKSAAGKGRWGGRRRGAGAPKGNLNGFKHGRRSRQLSEAAAVLAANPKIRDTLLALANRAGMQQAKAEQLAIRFFADGIIKGIKVENAAQARAVAELFQGLHR